jgi:hypothetical protein
MPCLGASQACLRHPRACGAWTGTRDGSVHIGRGFCCRAFWRPLWLCCRHHPVMPARRVKGGTKPVNIGGQAVMPNARRRPGFSCVQPGNPLPSCSRDHRGAAPKTAFHAQSRLAESATARYCTSSKRFGAGIIPVEEARPPAKATFNMDYAFGSARHNPRTLSQIKQAELSIVNC